MNQAFPAPRNCQVCVADARGRRRQLGFVACPRCHHDTFVYVDGPLPAGCPFCGLGLVPTAGSATDPPPQERDTFSVAALSPQPAAGEERIT